MLKDAQPLLQFIPSLQDPRLIGVFIIGQRVGTLTESPILGAAFYESVATGLAQIYRDMPAAKEALLRAAVRFNREVL
jgi:hypothetical protein